MAKKQSNNDLYSEKNIRLVSGLEHVRMRPGMYIGGTDRRAIHQLACETLALSIYQAFQGTVSQIDVYLNADKTLTVENNGIGLPTHCDPDLGPMLEFIMTHLSSRHEGTYRLSSSVGIAVLNAVSERTTVEVKRDGKIYMQQFQRGQISCPLHVFDNLVSGDEQGTIITFLPDIQVFDEIGFDVPKLEERLCEIAFLFPGLAISFHHNRTPYYEVNFTFPKGISDVVESTNEGRALLHPIISNCQEVTLLNNQGEPYPVVIDFAFQFVVGSEIEILSYVNSENTESGGTHEASLCTSLVETLEHYAKKFQLVNDINQLNIADLKGLTAIISVFHPDPHYASSTKAILANPDIPIAVRKVVLNATARFARKNPVAMKTLIQGVIANCK